MFQDVYDDFVSRVAVGKPGDTHQRWYLANGDIQGGASHVRGYSSQRYEIDDPTATNEADEADDGSSYDRKRRCYDVTLEFWVAFVCLGYDGASDCRHNGDRLEKVSEILDR